MKVFASARDSWSRALVCVPCDHRTARRMPCVDSAIHRVSALRQCCTPHALSGRAGHSQWNRCTQQFAHTIEAHPLLHPCTRTTPLDDKHTTSKRPMCDTVSRTSRRLLLHSTHSQFARHASGPWTGMQGSDMSVTTLAGSANPHTGMRTVMRYIIGRAAMMVRSNHLGHLKICNCMRFVQSRAWVRLACNHRTVRRLLCADSAIHRASAMSQCCTPHELSGRARQSQ